MTKPQSQIVGFDFTLPKNDNWPDINVVVTHLREWCKHYVFQEERGDSGYEHWQGRVRLIKARRWNEIKGKFCPGGNVTPTVDKQFQEKTFTYVMKADTRVAGPWDDRDYEEPQSLPVSLLPSLTMNCTPGRSPSLRLSKRLTTVPSSLFTTLRVPVASPSFVSGLSTTSMPMRSPLPPNGRHHAVLHVH